MPKRNMNLAIARQIAHEASKDIENALKAGKFDEVPDEVLVAYEKLRRNSETNKLIGYRLTADEVEEKAKKLELDPDQLIRKAKDGYTRPQKEDSL